MGDDRPSWIAWRGLPAAHPVRRRTRWQPERCVAFHEPRPGVLTALVRGELATGEALELHRRVQDELLARRPRRLVVELSGVRFLGLHGIAALERLRRCPSGCRHGMALGAVSPAAERALRLAGVLGRFDRAEPAWTDPMA